MAHSGLVDDCLGTRALDDIEDTEIDETVREDNER